MGSRKLNIGFIVGSNQVSGGGYQYEIKAIDILKKNSSEYYNFYFFSLSKEVVQEYRQSGIEIIYLQENKIQRVHRFLMRNLIAYKVFEKFNCSSSTIEKHLSNKYNIDLAYFLYPTFISMDLINIPYITTVWDLCHRDFNEFPEIRNQKKFEIRELLYNTILRKAVAITSDSKLGKENLIRRYCIDESRVHVLKFLPKNNIIKSEKYIDIKKRYSLKHDYVFYPAQFWAHKNHIYILKAIQILKEKYNIFIDAVFSGSNKGNLEYILNEASVMGISAQIHYVGFVDDEEIPFLYQQALSLVMPTYFGPTNIPPLEAFCYGAPVCYSDLEGLREQVEDAAFLMDLNNPESLSKHLITILSNENEVQNKIENGKKMLSEWTDKTFYHKIIQILDNYRNIQSCWK